MKVLMLTQRIDLDDPILAFTHSWAEKLAQRVERLYCVGLSVGRHTLDQYGVRVFSMGKERGYRILPDVRYLVNLYRAMRDIERDGGVDVIFSHMAPIFALAVAPYYLWKRVPLVHWYTHSSVNWRVKVAHHLCARVVSTFPTSYRYRHDKLTVVGHGIDTDLFSPEQENGEERTAPLILYVGRLSPVKELTTLLHATARLQKGFFKPFRIVFVGGLSMPQDELYLDNLKELGEQLNLGGFLSFEGPVPYGKELVNWYRRCTVHVNLTPVGSGDKAALEAMSCGKLCLVANEGFREVLGDVAERLLSNHGAPEDLAQKLLWALNLAPEDRRRIGLSLRERVIQMHGLDRLMDRLVELFKELLLAPAKV